MLDVASGEGYGCALLAQAAEFVVGLDLSASAVAAAAALYRRPNLQFQQGDATQLPFPDASFDLVTSFRRLSTCATQGR